MDTHRPAPFQEIAVVIWFIVFVVAVALFQLWYAAAFLFAFAQTKERTLLLMVGQALLMLAAFLYLGLALINGWSANVYIVVLMLIGAMLLSLIWRRHPSGLPYLLRHYPRGSLDVLAFRRPVFDLKRRVRTK
jgi:hypothetical protein